MTTPDISSLQDFSSVVTLLKIRNRAFSIWFRIDRESVEMTISSVFPLISAEELGIKDTVPAYLDPNLKEEDLATGVAFASGGSGYDPLTPKIVVRTIRVVRPIAPLNHKGDRSQDPVTVGSTFRVAVWLITLSIICVVCDIIAGPTRTVQGVHRQAEGSRWGGEGEHGTVQEHIPGRCW